MPWFVPERRGPQWRQSWWEQTLSNLSLPPPQLLAVFTVVIFLLSLSWYGDYKLQARRTEISFRFILFLLPAALVVVTVCMFKDGRFVFRLPWPDQETMRQAGSSPWGLAGLVLLLLFMVSYQSSFHSQWFKPLWRVD